MKKTDYFAIKTKALLGNGEALFELAWMHIWGMGCDVDFEKAYSLLEESIKHGFDEAKSSLDFSLKKENGTVVLNSDFAEIYESMKALRLAAEDGDPAAQFLFAQAKVTGEDTSPYMRKRGLIWLEKSAQQKFPPALYMLGILYIGGNRVPRNNDKGMSLIREAAKGGNISAIKYLAEDEPQFVIPILNKLDAENNANAQGILGQMYCTGIGVDKDTSKGIEYWEKSAANGDSDAMFNLGMCYEQGFHGITKNIDKAVYWFEKGSESGDAACMANLGNIIQEKDPERAFKLYSKAAEKDEPHALNNLGTLYKKGIGCEKNVEMALSCYEKSANAGCVSAMHNLVLYYVDDVAVPHDYEKANKWLLMAADNGDEESIMRVAKGYEEGDIFPQDDEKALKYFNILAEKNNPEALTHLGNLYRRMGEWQTAKECFIKAINFHHIPAYHELGLFYCYPEVENHTEAVRLFSVAANAGYPPAEYELGVCYRLGEGIQKDMEKTLYWITKASEDGYHLATNNLGLYYLEGIGVERDLNKAVGYFREAAVNGIPDAQTMLGLCYFQGNGVDQDYSEAVKWFTMAARQNEPDAQYHLYLCYSKGLGVEVNMEKAMQSLRFSANNGFDRAVCELEKVEKTNTPGYIDRDVLENILNKCGGMMMRENGEPYIVHHNCPEGRAGKPMNGKEYHQFLIDAFLECLKMAGEKVDYYKEPLQDTTNDKSDKYPDIVHYNVSGFGSKQVFYKVFSGIPAVEGWDYREFVSICKDAHAYGKIILGESYCLDTNGETPINGSAFATRYKSFSIYPEEKDSILDEMLGSADLVQILASAWEKMDTSVLSSYIDANCHYGSDWVFVEMSSKQEYMDYLEGKFASIKRDDSVVDCQIDRNFETDAYSILMGQDDHCGRLIFNSENGRFVDIRMIQAVYPNDWEDEYTKRLSAALPKAVGYINDYFCSEGIPESEVKWNTVYMSSLHFQHLNFTYGGNVYSVLIALVIRGDDDMRHVHNLFLHKDIRNQQREVENSDLIPCLMPLDINTLEPLVGGLHLVNAQTMRNIVPFIRENKVKMTDWEIQNLGINYVMQHLGDEGFSVYDFCDVPTMEPNVWFVGENGKKSYVVVNAICTNNKDRFNFKVRHNLMTELSEYDGYYAEVLIHSAESVAYDAEGNVVPLSQRYDDKNPVEIIYRGDKVCVKFVGLQYIESKAAKSGVTDETIYIVDPKKAGVRKVGDD